MASGKTIPIPVSSDYVSWGFWEVVRENVQNWQDAKTKGADSTIRFYPKTEKQAGRVMFRNVGAALKRENLVFGGSEKKDDPTQIGHFGEGMKLAWAAGLKAGLQFFIRSGGERWTPKLGTHPDFGSAEILLLDIGPVKDQGMVEVEIRGVEEEDWQEIQKRFLFLSPPPADQVLTLDNGLILTGAEYRGKLFRQGIYICDLPDRYAFGYDLFRVQLDRDRKVAEPWSLRFELGNAIGDAAKRKLMSPSQVYRLLSESFTESKSFDTEFFTDTEMAAVNAAGEHFKTVHGRVDVPVGSVGESADVAHAGLQGVMVAPVVKRVLEKAFGPTRAKVDQRATDVKLYYGADALTDEEMANLRWAVGLVGELDPKLSLDSVVIVEFVGEAVNAVYDAPNDRTELARRRLANRVDVLTSLSHESGHRLGGSGEAGMRQAQVNILAEIAARNIK